MYRSTPTLKRIFGRNQQGIGLPAAIFIITLLAVMAAAIFRLITTNAETFVEGVSLDRAFFAAQSGANFGVNALSPPDIFPTFGSCFVTPREYTFSVDGINSCTALVTCSEDADIASVKYFTINSVGTCNDVTRTIQVGVRDD